MSELRPTNLPGLHQLMTRDLPFTLIRLILYAAAMKGNSTGVVDSCHLVTLP